MRNKKKNEQPVEEHTYQPKPDTEKLKYIDALQEEGFRVTDDNGVVTVLCKVDEIHDVHKKMGEIAKKCGFSRSYGASVAKITHTKHNEVGSEDN